MSLKTSAARRWLVTLVAAMAMVAAACGDDDDDATSDTTVAAEEQPATTAGPSDSGADTTAASDTGADTTAGGDEEAEEPEDADPNGVVRVGFSLLPTGSAVQLDPSQTPSPPTFTHILLYDTLLRANMDGTYSPGLAESAEIVDPQTLTVTLRDGLEFSDGTPLDAEAVKFSIERNLASDNRRAFVDTEFFTVESVVVDSPTELTINLTEPVAGLFYSFLSRGETMPVSPTAVRDGVDLMTNPVGAGPFTLETMTPEEIIRLVKNPTHWDADNVRAAALEIVHVSGPEATQNALRSGAIDAFDVIPPDVVNALGGTNLTIQQEISQSSHFMALLCKSTPPLDDVRVRQALNYALDRDAINDVLYGGKSEPMWGFWSSDHPLHDPDLDGFYERDLDRARELLAEAGFPDGFEIDFVVPSTGGTGLVGTEVVQQQWAEAGVQLNIVSSSDVVREFFVEGQYPGQFFLNGNPGLGKVSRNLAGDGLGNVCGWNHEGLNALIDQLRAVDPDSDEAVELWHQTDRLVLEEAMVIFGVFNLAGNAWNPDRLGGVDFYMDFQGLPRLSPWSTYVKG